MPPGFSYDPSNFKNCNLNNFIEILCFQIDSVEVLKAKSENPTTEYVIKDDDGRPLLRESELMKKNNIEVNDFVPKTLNNQIDKKIGNWKTNYDVINEAPFRPEPIGNIF